LEAIAEAVGPFISILAHLRLFERGPRSFNKVSSNRRAKPP
jgi:hypothetical protein